MRPSADEYTGQSCDCPEFPSIDHLILKEQLRWLIPCRRTWELACLIVDSSNRQESESFFFPGDDLFTPAMRRRGLLIGNLTSQHFANFYLHPLDHFVREQLEVQAMIRYVDDILLFHDSQKFLHTAACRITQFLQALRLMILFCNYL